jgi:ketosteroid isomerase-like protein
MMRMPLIRNILLSCSIMVACSSPPGPTTDANAGIDSLNARIVQSYQSHDPRAYGALYTDSALFEWPAFNTVRGAKALETMAQTNWASLKDMNLELSVANRRFASDHATEFGAFKQSYSDSSGARMAEYGRYVALLVRQEDGSWKMDRFFGFSDSTRTLAKKP